MSQVDGDWDRQESRRETRCQECQPDTNVLLSSCFLGGRYSRRDRCPPNKRSRRNRIDNYQTVVLTAQDDTSSYVEELVDEDLPQRQRKRQQKWIASKDENKNQLKAGSTCGCSIYMSWVCTWTKQQNMLEGHRMWVTKGTSRHVIDLGDKHLFMRNEERKD